MEYPSETTDAIGFEPFRLDEPYGIIVQNNPVNKVDPFGLEASDHNYNMQCLRCDWQELSACVAETYDSEQLEACKAVCEVQTPQGRLFCAICVIGKADEFSQCSKHCNLTYDCGKKKDKCEK